MKGVWKLSESGWAGWEDGQDERQVGHPKI